MEGKIYGRNGHEYKVEFAGDGVPTTQIAISEVSITMNAHERKFVGYKSTSAKVTVMTDSPLLELYAEGVRDISVTITDVTDERVVFYGYVVPFTFEQPFSGVADSVTIDCVDGITATKDVKYMSLNDADLYGIDESAHDIIRSIFSIAGMSKKDYKIVYHLNYGADVLDTKVAQAGFLQDEMTALEAINAILLFLGYTACLVGYDLHLYDEHCLTHAADAHARRTMVGEFVDVSGKRRWTRAEGDSLRMVEIDNSMIHDGITMSVERAYDGIQLKLSGSDTSVLLPDVCSMDNIIKNTDGRGTDRVMLMGSIDGQEYWEYRMPVQSKVMDMGRWDGNTLVDWNSPAYIKATGDYAWSNGAMMIVGQHFNIEKLNSWVGANAYIYPKDGGETPLLWLRAYNTTEGFAGEQNFTRYAHTGGMLELKLKYRVVKEDWLYYTKTRDRGTSGYESFIQIKMGDVYYYKDYSNESIPVYSDRPYGYLLEKGGNLVPTWSAASRYQDKVLFIVPNEADGRQISVNLEWIGRAFEHTKIDDDGYVSSTTYWTDGIFIEQLELVGYGDDVWDGHPDMHHEYAAYPDEMLEVEVGLSTRASKQGENPDKPLGVIGINARPGIVVSSSLPAYMGRAEGNEPTPLCGIIMEQLKARYGEPHERFTMTVEGTDYLPSDTIIFNDNKYTVEGYEMDIVESTTTLIIN
jgi:hypothetical protein